MRDLPQGPWRDPTQRSDFDSIDAGGRLDRPTGFGCQEEATAHATKCYPSDAELDRLTEGNKRYVSGTTRRHDFAHEREALSSGQNPFTAVLSCADSRIAPELCFDTARGDLFF